MYVKYGTYWFFILKIHLSEHLNKHHNNCNLFKKNKFSGEVAVAIKV